MSSKETSINHDDLWSITKKLPEDYEPYGQQKRNGNFDDDEEQPDSKSGYYGDCSCGCKWFTKLKGKLGMDWGVCTNPASHRVGLLTFEHQGCYHGFEPEENEEDQ